MNERIHRIMFDDRGLILEALQKGIDEAMIEHKRAGLPVVIYRAVHEGRTDRQLTWCLDAEGQRATARRGRGIRQGVRSNMRLGGGWRRDRQLVVHSHNGVEPRPVGAGLSV